MEYVYIPKGVCASKMTFNIENNIVLGYKTDQGCPGNSLGLAKLLVGQNIDDMIQKLEGIHCGFRKTSCPDQIAQALKYYKEKRNN